MKYHELTNRLALCFKFIDDKVIDDLIMNTADKIIRDFLRKNNTNNNEWTTDDRQNG